MIGPLTPFLWLGLGLLIQIALVAAYVFKKHHSSDNL